MSRVRNQHRVATAADFFAIGEEERFHELLDGEILSRAAPTGEHGGTQADLVSRLHAPFSRRAGGSGGPGGWWFEVEVEIRFGPHICRPDIAGWRRERVPSRPRGTPVEVLPDWVCEILSTNRRNDLIRKKRIYHEHKVGHYWVVDPDEETLSVNRWHAEGYLEVLAAERGQVVRGEPFEAIELPLSALFGDEEE